MDDQTLLAVAIEEAQLGLSEGGIPIGSALADAQGNVVGRGHNLRVQRGDPTAHAEVAAIRDCGRRRDWDTLTMASTLSPCVMCSGTALLFRIPRIVIGETENFQGAEDLLRQRGVELVHMQDAGCIEMMRQFIERRPELWNEDIGV